MQIRIIVYLVYANMLVLFINMPYYLRSGHANLGDGLMPYWIKKYSKLVWGWYWGWLVWVENFYKRILLHWNLKLLSRLGSTSWQQGLQYLCASKSQANQCWISVFVHLKDMMISFTFSTSYVATSLHNEANPKGKFLSHSKGKKIVKATWKLHCIYFNINIID